MYYYLLWKFFLLLKSSFIKSFLLWNQRISLTADSETAWLYFRSVRIFYSHNFVNFWLLWEKKKTRSFGSCEKLWQLKRQKTLQRREREMEWKDNAPHRVKCAAKVHLVFICHRRHSRRGTHLDFGFWRSLSFLTFDKVRFCHWPFWS